MMAWHKTDKLLWLTDLHMMAWHKADNDLLNDVS